MHLFAQTEGDFEEAREDAVPLCIRSLQALMVGFQHTVALVAHFLECVEENVEINGPCPG